MYNSTMCSAALSKMGYILAVNLLYRDRHCSFMCFLDDVYWIYPPSLKPLALSYLQTYFVVYALLRS